MGSPRLPGGDGECIAIVLFLYAFLLQGVGLTMNAWSRAQCERQIGTTLFVLGAQDPNIRRLWTDKTLSVLHLQKLLGFTGCA